MHVNDQSDLQYCLIMGQKFSEEDDARSLKQREDTMDKCDHILF